MRRKLSLKRETVRTLQDASLARVAAGTIYTSAEETCDTYNCGTDSNLICPRRMPDTDAAKICLLL